jgi:hypothetical protein
MLQYITSQPATALLGSLGRLPPELRNMVYEYVFDSVDLHRLEGCDHPLSRTCYQLRNETMRLF